VDCSKVKQHTDETLYAYYDEIAAAPQNERPMLEKSFGLKFNPLGLMSTMRHIYQPKSNTIRDWMHMLVSGGVANTQMALMLTRLMAINITLPTIGKFIESVHLPHRHGKTNANWVSRKRLGKTKESLASFAGILLSLIPILACFMAELIGVDHPLYQDKLCFDLLNQIIGVLSTGPDKCMMHIPLLTALIKQWSEMYERLYPGKNVKPKFHNFVIHMISDMVRTGKLLSCFVTERKHRATKRAALFVFRHIDNTVVKDMLNRQCEAIRGGTETLFARQYIINPWSVNFAGVNFRASKQAVLPCGSLFAGDVLILVDGRVGLLERFWMQGGDDVIVAQIALYAPCETKDNQWDHSNTSTVAINVDSIVDAVMWFTTSDSTIQVIVPVCATL